MYSNNMLLLYYEVNVYYRNKGLWCILIKLLFFVKIYIIQFKYLIYNFINGFFIFQNGEIRFVINGIQKNSKDDINMNIMNLSV